MTAVKVIKAGIAFSGVATQAYTGFKSGANAKDIAANFVSAYVPYDINSNTVFTGNLATGYVPLIGAWAFGKVMNRLKVL